LTLTKHFYINFHIFDAIRLQTLLGALGSTLASTANPRTMAPTHVLLETASGYAVFQSKLYEEIGSRTADVQESLDDIQKFKKMVTLVSFMPFKSAAHALENANDISEGVSLFFFPWRWERGGFGGLL